MKKQKKLVVGNWKMNPLTLEDAKNILNNVKKISPKLKKTEVVICPPYIYIPLLSKTRVKNLSIGAQNAHYEINGSFTGEVSFAELDQFGVDFVILGHSERRKMGEDNVLINKKIKAITGCGMKAILCIGESQRDHGGDYLSFIRSQISECLKDIPKKSIDNVIIAYEPIWAIGAKDAMSPVDLHEMNIFIKKVLRDAFGVLADDVRVIYGGAVDKNNAFELVKEGNVSGFLVGRESLKAKDFVEIIKIIESI